MIMVEDGTWLWDRKYQRREKLTLQQAAKEVLAVINMEGKEL